MSTATHPGIAPKGKFIAAKVSRKTKVTLKKDKPRRTTVSLSTNSAAIVDRFKEATGFSTSRAIEELILRSEPRKPRIKMVNGRAVFDLPISISTEELLRLEDESW